MGQLDLTEQSAGISHKPDAVRVPKVGRAVQAKTKAPGEEILAEYMNVL